MLDMNGLAALAQGLLIFVAIVGYFIRLEHRLTEIEVRLNSVVKILESLDGKIK